MVDSIIFSCSLFPGVHVCPCIYSYVNNDMPKCKHLMPSNFKLKVWDLLYE